ncbi:cyclic GMP-AMP synthase-like receptor isoform X2 [Tachypleus tridentatus]|uniref:cyclic GMP-AMP synthase-like receptor isoform X2 n=1 Tax=Tachypleus tridentatus TaxID=6853 RepID=UPI003FD406D7
MRTFLAWQGFSLTLSVGVVSLYLKQRITGNEMSCDNSDCKLFSELKKVLRNIKLDSNEIKTNNAIVNAVLQEIIGRMKRHDALFSVVYQRLVYTGSYYQGLRVCEVTEYDVNLILKFPLREQVWSITPSQSGPSKKLKILTHSNAKIDVDLVPTLEFTNVHNLWSPRDLSYYDSHKGVISLGGLSK